MKKLKKRIVLFGILGGLIASFILFSFIDVMQVVSVIAIPLIIVIIPIYGYSKGLKVYEVFTDGAKEGFQVALRIIPFWWRSSWLSVLSVHPEQWICCPGYFPP
ncbi:MAG: hypothetical protein U5N56_12380 [Candidatus Marinimicrobia bacterium]|nr:hypothetical protein [Candidatus Neomarinimicrobiota bacterium]